MIGTYMPRPKIRVVRDCQNWPNLKGVFEGIKWMDILTTPMTTSARTFVFQKIPFEHFATISEKYDLKG